MNNIKQELLKIEDWRHPFEIEPGVILKCKDYHNRTWLHDWSKWRLDIHKLFLNVTIDTLGGALSNYTTLDIGCNDGYFSYETAKLGVKHATGVELRDYAFKKAQLIKEYFQVNNLEIIQDNIEVMTKNGNLYDIVFAYGLVYHLTNPIEIIEHIGSLTRHALLIATFINKDTDSSLALMKENVDHAGSGAKSLVTRPSEKALVDMLEFAGFSSISRYIPYPFFTNSNSGDFQINKDEWAFYLAFKKDTDYSKIPHTIEYSNKTAFFNKKIQWIKLL